MVLSIINFGWIFITTFLLGYGGIRLILGNGRAKHHVDLILAAGLMTVTVYAEAFSIFGPVNLWASIGLGVIGIVIFFLLHKEIISYVRSIIKEKRFLTYFVLILLLVAGGGNFKFCSNGL